ncbi:uncharacterized protein LOC124285310 isoform X1 [Haliotis rubra]|uniref:uncharacterized protein LOC124285310 isoform X1 n=1 Tax=Haliotis rubra TaxID=36100 RepID=UPI001EE5C50E|nr:uncharacterized protein LOC124285310 isoform X1 [Haliotis rubra]
MEARTKPGKRSVRFNTAPPKKDVEVLTDSSLVMLARNIGPENLNGVVLAMMLNIPTTTIVNCIYAITDDGISEENEKLRISVAEKCLLLWKELTADVKTRDRVKYMERALREMGKNDIADVFVDRHSNNQEITQDAFL